MMVMMMMMMVVMINDRDGNCGGGGKNLMFLPEFRERGPRLFSSHQRVTTKSLGKSILNCSSPVYGEQ